MEHVLPQNPAADSEWVKTFTEDERAEWVHRLGNLVLLSGKKNSAASNYDFDVKKEKYFKGKVANFALTIEVLNSSTWKVDVLEARQARLLQTLASLWRL